MKKKNKMSFKNSQEKKRFIFFSIIRLVLIASVVFVFQSNRWGIFYLNIFVFLLTFVPFLIKKFFSISLPFEIEILFLFSLLFTTFLEKFLAGFIVQMILGLFFGMLGIPLMYALYHNSNIRSNDYLIFLVPFCFSVSAGAIWEVIRYSIISIYRVNLGEVGIDYAPRGLLLTIIGATIISSIGYADIRYNDGRSFSRLISAFIRKNPKMFADYKNSKKHLFDLVKKGESEHLEFKSTLRTNMHTKQHDKKIEHAVLKTITAFLNTDGGTLLVGVSDDGSINGIEHDGFQSNDRFYQHFTNLIKNKIGNEYQPFIKSTIIPVEDSHVLKIDCIESKKEVFLKIDDGEEFFIRTGPASVKLDGRKLVEYVNEKFR